MRFLGLLEREGEREREEVRFPGLLERERGEGEIPLAVREGERMRFPVLLERERG